MWVIKGIVCIGANGVMGKDGSMPWGDKPLDGKHFRSLTEGHTVVMGRKTFESMNAQPLPNRNNIVLTRSIPVTVEDIVEMDKHNECDTWIIGGSQVFKAFLPYIEEFYVTTVGEVFEGDTFFPDIHQDYMWNHEYLGMGNGKYHLVYRKFTKRNR